MVLLPLAASALSAVPPAIAKAAQAFEGMALNQLLAPMFETVDTAKGPFGGGGGEEAWKPMMTAELAKHLAAHGGLGLARPVMQQMLRMQEDGQAQAPGPAAAAGA